MNNVHEWAISFFILDRRGINRVMRFLMDLPFRHLLLSIKIFFVGGGGGGLMFVVYVVQCAIRKYFIQQLICCTAI